MSNVTGELLGLDHKNWSFVITITKTDNIDIRITYFMPFITR